MLTLTCVRVYCKDKLRHVSIRYIHCIAKTGTFFLWVLIYMIIMRLTIFKSNKVTTTVKKEEALYPSNETELWQVNIHSSIFIISSIIATTNHCRGSSFRKLCRIVERFLIKFLFQKQLS